MIIRGTLVLLRAIEQQDNQMLLEIINDPETEYMLGGWSFPVSRKDQDEWFSSLVNDTHNLRCVIDVDSRAVGVVMLSAIDYKNGNAEVHIKLATRDARGKGYGADALNTITDFAFRELRLKCLYARISKHNVPSQRLFEKCGFTEEGILKSRLFKRGEYIDVFSYCKLC